MENFSFSRIFSLTVATLYIYGFYEKINVSFDIELGYRSFIGFAFIIKKIFWYTPLLTKGLHCVRLIDANPPFLNAGADKCYFNLILPTMKAFFSTIVWKRP